MQAFDHMTVDLAKLNENSTSICTNPKYIATQLAQHKKVQTTYVTAIDNLVRRLVGFNYDYLQVNNMYMIKRSIQSFIKLSFLRQQTMYLRTRRLRRIRDLFILIDILFQVI